MSKPWAVLVVLVLAVIGGSAWAFERSRAPAPLDAFAACLAEKGAVMYGTSWCPHCARQKEFFGRSFRKAAYVECSLPGNPSQQAPRCTEARISAYPTWVFADGSQLKGTQELWDLASKTGCALP